MKKKEIYKKEEVDEIFKIFKSWLSIEMYKSGYTWNYIEKRVGNAERFCRSIL